MEAIYEKLFSKSFEEVSRIINEIHIVVSFKVHVLL